MADRDREAATVVAVSSNEYLVLDDRFSVADGIVMICRLLSGYVMK